MRRFFPRRSCSCGLTGTPGLAAGVVVGLLLAVSLTMGCRPEPTPTPEPPVDPRGVLRQSADRLVALRSVAFDLEHEVGATQLLPGVEMTRAYGETEIGKGFRFTVEAQLGSSYFEIEAVVLDGRTYMTNFLTGNWEEVPPDTLPFNFSDVGRSFAALLDSLRDPELLATEPLNGRDTYRLRGLAWSDDLAVLVPNAAKGYEVEMELWIDRERADLVMASMTGPVVATDVPEVVRTLRLTGIDAPVEILAPAALGR